MIYCFDTSAINRLLDDPERDAIVRAILAVGSFRVSAHNVLEAAKTTDTDRRRRLVDLMMRLSDGKRPLDRPNTILLAYAKAHAVRASRAVVNRDDRLDGVWIALNQSEAIDEEARQEAFAWTAEMEDDFSAIVARDREQFQALFRAVPGERPKSVASTLRLYLSKADECHALIGDVYTRHTRKALSKSDYQRLVREPAWPLFFLGHAYAMHQRSIQERGFSARRNAGAIDLSQSVYLTICDRFVTDDRAQYKALRLLNVLNKKHRTQVLRYDTFRTRLLAF